MEKKILKIEPAVSEKFRYNGMDVEVLPYIPNEVRFIIIQTYLDDIFGDGDVILRYLSAEDKLVFSIIKYCTNIDFEMGGSDEENKAVIESVFSTGLWYAIRDRIKDYNDLRSEIKEVIQLQQLENNDWKSIFRFISDWVSKELNSEKLKSFSEELQKQTDELSKVYPIIKTEPKKAKRTRKSKAE